MVEQTQEKILKKEKLVDLRTWNTLTLAGLHILSVFHGLSNLRRPSVDLREACGNVRRSWKFPDALPLPTASSHKQTMFVCLVGLLRLQILSSSFLPPPSPHTTAVVPSHHCPSPTQSASQRWPSPVLGEWSSHPKHVNSPNMKKPSTADEGNGRGPQVTTTPQYASSAANRIQPPCCPGQDSAGATSTANATTTV